MAFHRRDFLLHTAATAAATTLSTTFARAAEDADAEKADEASDLRIAVIGIRGRGNSHISGLRKHLVALCDVDQKVLAAQQVAFKEKHQRDVAVYTDYRKLLERDDIDAVSIATPNHWHSLMGIQAMQAGKHVYTEKPVSHNVWEGRQLVEAARRYDRICQCGTQSRSSKSLAEAVEFVRAGNLGKIQYALGTCYKPRNSIGKLDKPLEIPQELDYDLWCGPAAKVDLYRPHLHYDWHWDFNTGNGDMGNQGIHQMDIARWFLGENQLAPRTISIGGRLGYDDAGDTANTQVVLHDYPAAPLLFETRGLPSSKEGQKKWGASMDTYRGSRVGVIVQCEKGYIVVPSYFDAVAYDADGKELKKWKDHQDGHYANWLEAIAKGDRSILNAEILEGHLSSALCHTGNISHKLGKKVTASEIRERVKSNDLLADSFNRMADHLKKNEVDIDAETITLGPMLEIDPATETLAGDERASALLTRSYRKGFVVPDMQKEMATARV